MKDYILIYRSTAFCHVRFAILHFPNSDLCFFQTYICNFQIINTKISCKIRKKIVTLHANKKKFVLRDHFLNV